MKLRDERIVTINIGSLLQIGFLYGSVVEDYFTGYNLHCRGWKSVYLNPSRPAFVGSAPINMRDILVQHKRGTSGLLQVALSRFCPLTWGAARTSIPQSFCYASIAFWPLQSLLLFYALLHPICLFNRISLYPKVTTFSLAIVYIISSWL